MEIWNSFLEKLGMLITNINMSDNAHAFLSNHIIPILKNTITIGIIWVIIAIMLLFTKKYKRFSFFIIFGLIICSVIGNEVLKPVFLRFNQFITSHSIPLFVPTPGRYSFPSGYIMMSFSSAMIMFYASKDMGIYASVVAFLVAFSQLYILTEYPVDFILGALLGFLVGFILVLIYRLRYKRVYFDFESYDDYD